MYRTLCNAHKGASPTSDNMSLGVLHNLNRTWDFNGILGQEPIHLEHFLTSNHNEHSYVSSMSPRWWRPSTSPYMHMPAASGYPPHPSSTSNNLLLVGTLHLLLTPRLVDIFHNNLFLLLVDTLRVPMVGNTLHNNLCPFLDTLHLVQVPMVVDTFL